MDTASSFPLLPHREEVMGLIRRGPGQDKLSGIIRRLTAEMQNQGGMRWKGDEIGDEEETKQEGISYSFHESRTTQLP